MAASASFTEFLRECLARLGPLGVRRMFGKTGVFCEGVMLGMVSDNSLYLRVDAGNREAMKEAASQPLLRYVKGGQSIDLSFYRLPDRLLDEPDELLVWARSALAAAHRVAAHRGPRPSRRGAKPHLTLGVTMTTSTPPQLRNIDHVHVYVADRSAAETWYERVLGLKPMKGFESWAVNGGPLTLVNARGTVHIALFERGLQATRSAVAFGVGADDFLKLKTQLRQALDRPPTTEDHELSMSLYFSDPDGNPYEITTYEHAAVRHALGASGI